MTIILMLIALGLGGYGGYRIGSYFIRQENATLLRQIDRLDQYSKTWSAEASNSFQLSSQVAQQHTNNISVSIHTVIQLLSAFQQQHANTLSNQEQIKISELINQAKLITEN